MSLKRTDEQLACIDASKKYDKIKINARAGAAKTTTLCMIAEENPVPSLMLVFNKAASWILNELEVKLVDKWREICQK